VVLLDSRDVPRCSPQLYSTTASLTDEPPEGSNWIHEVKHDGYRTMLVVERGTALTYTRNGHEATDTQASSLRHANCRAGRQSLMARSLCRTHAEFLTLRRCKQGFGLSPHA
jgi:hypothetical protein